jgi:hypothetical protein
MSSPANGQTNPEAFPYGANTPAEGAPPAEEAPAAEVAPDPFDPASLRLTQSLTTATGVRKALISVPVTKPDKSWFFRCHPAEEYRLQTYVIEAKADRETYLVSPALWAELATEPTLRPKLLVTCINRQAVVFLWDLALPRPDGRRDEWGRTAMEAAELATKSWTRVVANMSAGCNDVYTASAQLAEPEWPDLPFRELLRIAFKDRFIDALDHPKLRQLRGEV